MYYYLWTNLNPVQLLGDGEDSYFGALACVQCGLAWDSSIRNVVFKNKFQKLKKREVRMKELVKMTDTEMELMIPGATMKKTDLSEIRDRVRD